MPNDVQVRVPASTTNLGPGFDALGLALQLHNRVRVRLTAGPVQVHVSGEGKGVLELGVENLVYQAISRIYRQVGLQPPSVEIRLQNAIPVSRGLGSSSTAIVGGLVAGNALLQSPLDREAVLALAVEMEGHPDNVTPALLGGFQVTSLSDDKLTHLRLPTPTGLRAVVCVPEASISTAAARAALPPSYSRADAVFNIGRVSVLVAALVSGRTELLDAAMEDQIHQPYRAALVPGFHAALDAARKAGALGACLSGSGSTMLALTSGNEVAIGEAMAAAVREAGVNARWLALDVDEDGAALETPAV